MGVSRKGREHLCDIRKDHVIKDVSGVLDSKELYEKNVALVVHIVKKFMATLEPKGYFQFDDLFQEGSIGLWKAAKSFKQEKGYKFSTYAGRCITNQILIMVRNEKGFQFTTYLDNHVKDSENEEITYLDLIEDRSKNVEGQLLFDGLISFLNQQKPKYERKNKVYEEREKQVFSYIVQGYKQKEIMKELGITQRIAANHYSSLRYRIRADWFEEENPSSRMVQRRRKKKEVS